MHIPIWIVVGFQQRDWPDTQNLENYAFCILPVISAQCVIGSEKCPYSVILLKYDDDNYCQSYGQIKEAFRARTKNDILQLYISDDDYTSSNAGLVEVGYNSDVFDIRYRQSFTSY